MGFISGTHLVYLVILLVVVLVIFGPGKLPDVGAGMGRAIREFRKASTEVKDSVVNATAEHKPDETAPTVIAPDQKPSTPVSSGTKTGG